jgi:hypothetical protein
MARRLPVGVTTDMTLARRSRNAEWHSAVSQAASLRTLLCLRCVATELLRFRLRLPKHFANKTQEVVIIKRLLHEYNIDVGPLRHAT